MLGSKRMAQEARALTRQNFGRTMRMFAPLYLSNECINNCRYCGFSRDNPILRVTLTVEQVVAEARHLAAQGFRHVLLVAGEHPKLVNESYLADCIRALAPLFPSISLELGPMETAGYKPLVEAGAEGLVVYQETYNRGVYAEMHTSGPKRDFNWRLACPERAYAAGFRRIGIGALFGLAPWRPEAMALAAHLEYLLKHCWQANFTVSLPRLRPAAGEFVPPYSLGERALAQLVCAFRICFPQVGIVLSTREPAPLRDALVSLGVTMMSSGSHTEPGWLHRSGAARRAPDGARPHSAARCGHRCACHRSIRNQRRTFPGGSRQRSAPARVRARLEGLGPGADRAMRIFVNGEHADYDDGFTVEDLVRRHALSPETTLVELNGVALHRREWTGRTLRENDRLEILRVAAGG